MPLRFKIISFCFFCFFNPAFGQQLPPWNALQGSKKPVDWLVLPVAEKAGIFQSIDGRDIVLYNGLVRRTFRITPDLVCTDFKNLSNNQQLLRAVKAEARLTINGKSYPVGGLYGQTENAYLLPEWIDSFKTSDSAFHYINYSVEDIKPFLNWKTSMWTGNKKNATGKSITFHFKSSLPALKGLNVAVHYSIYDGIPLISKWVTLQNNSGGSVMLDQVVNEILAVVEEESAVEGNTEQMAVPNGIYVENNFAFNNAMRYKLSDQATHWKKDSTYTSQVNYRFQTPCLLEVHPKINVGINLNNGGSFESIRTYEL